MGRTFIKIDCEFIPLSFNKKEIKDIKKLIPFLT